MLTKKALGILFDFGGTLDADGEPWGLRFHRSYAREGGRLPLDAFLVLFEESDRRLERWSGIETLGLRDTAYVQAKLLAELLPADSAVTVDRMAEGFVSDAQRIADRNLPILHALSAQFRLGVISNYTGNLRPCLAELGLADCFEVTTDSALVGVRKPDPRIFQTTLEALGLDAHECWMVGDNPFADIRAAASMGFLTCWIAPATRVVPDDVRPSQRISELPQLPAVVN